MSSKLSKKILIPCLLLGAACSQADSNGIYKVTDEHGNTIYTNVAPKKQQGQAERVEIKQPNLSQEGEHLPGDDDTFFEELRLEHDQQDEQRRQRRKKREAALEELQQAREAYENAQQVRPGDYRTNPNGGIRHRPEYRERIEEARERLEAAEEAYEQLR